MKKNKKYYQTLSRYPGYGFLIIISIPTIISIIGLIIKDESMSQHFIIFISMIPFISLLLYLGYYWVEFDNKGIHSKNLFGHICTIYWNDLVKIDKKILGSGGGAIDCYIFYDKKCKVEKIKSLYNKRDGMIKIRKSAEIKKIIIKYCQDINILSRVQGLA